MQKDTKTPLSFKRVVKFKPEEKQLRAYSTSSEEHKKRYNYLEFSEIYQTKPEDCRCGAPARVFQEPGKRLFSVQCLRGCKTKQILVRKTPTLAILAWNKSKMSKKPYWKSVPSLSQFSSLEEAEKWIQLSRQAFETRLKTPPKKAATHGRRYKNRIKLCLNYLIYLSSLVKFWKKLEKSAP